MDVRNISQKILKIRKNLSSKIAVNERCSDSSYFETCIPLTLQDLVRNYSPTHVNQLKRSQLLLMRNKALYSIIIKYKTQGHWDLWKSISQSLPRLRRKTQSCLFNPLKLSPVLSLNYNPSTKLTPMTPSESNRKKTIQKLESSVKLFRVFLKVQKKNSRVSFKLLKINLNLLKISEIFENFIRKTFKTVIFSIRTWPKHELSMITSTPLSITPIVRGQSSMTREKSVSFVKRPLASPGMVSKRYSNEEFEALSLDPALRDSIKFDLPNMSSYESLNVSNVRHHQFDSLEISNSFIATGLVDESLVELEGDNFDEEVSPKFVNRSGEVIGISGKSASTAVVPRRFTYVDRYNYLASRDTITEVSVSKCSVSDIMFEAKIDGTKNLKTDSKRAEKWKESNRVSTSSIFRSIQEHNLGKIITKRRQNSFAQLNKIEN